MVLDGAKQANRPPLGLSWAFLVARPPKLVGSAAPWFGVFTFFRPLPNFIGMTTGARHVGRELFSAPPVECRQRAGTGMHKAAENCARLQNKITAGTLSTFAAASLHQVQGNCLVQALVVHCAATCWHARCNA